MYMHGVEWSNYPNFRPEEFRCRHTGECRMQADFLARLQALRDAFGAPMVVISGYRSPRHPIEAAKPTRGAHAMGRAADIAVQGAAAVRLLQLALGLGFTGIGVKQSGTGRYLHLDDVSDGSLPRPMIWSY